MVQLDFIGQLPKEEIEQEQFMLWDKDFEPTIIALKPKSRKSKTPIDYRHVDELFNSFNQEELEVYKDYWQGVAPKNDTEVFQRWFPKRWHTSKVGKTAVAIDRFRY